MAKPKVVLNRSGVRALLRSAEMKAICEEKAKEIADRCGDGFKTNTRTGKNRVNAMVFASTYQAKARNARENTILKSLK